MQTSEPQPTKLEILAGGTNIVVTFDDQRPEETAFVRIIKLRQLQQYGQLVIAGDEAGQVGLFAGKDAAWVDALTNASAEKVLEEGQRLNADFFVRWAARQAAMGNMLNEKVHKLTSPTSPPKSPSNAG